MRGVTMIRWLAAAAFVVVGSGCPSAPRDAGTASRATLARIESFAPLGFAADARAADRATILGIDASDHSVVLPLAAPQPPRSANAPPWSAATWRAALAVAHALDKDVDDVVPYVRGGAADDDSAMVAVGALAAATGLSADARIAVAGSALPDGSIVAPAVASDLANLYERTTGKHLPEPMPLAPSELALDAAPLAELEATYQDWRRELVGQWQTILELDSTGQLPPALARASQLARTAAERAEHAHLRGLTVEAYARMERAIAFATATSQTAHLLALARGGDLAAVATTLRGDLDANAAANLEDRIAAARPATRAGCLATVTAFEAAISATDEARAAEQIVGTVLRGLDVASAGGEPLGGPELAARVVEAAVPGLIASARARVNRSVAERELTRASAAGGAYAAPVERLQREAHARTAAGGDGHDPATLDLHAAWGDTSVAASLYALARGELAFARAERELVLRVSLGVETDAFGVAIAVRDDAALTALVAAAERHARAAAHAARVATGEVPVGVRLAYQVALVDRDGDADARVDALVGFWRASALAELAVMLARD